MRRLLIIGLWAFIFFAIGFAVVNRYHGKKAVPATAHSEQADTLQNGVMVYYFITNIRCPTCIRIENQTRETVASYSKRPVEFRLVNTDIPRNKHFIRDYQLTNSTVVVAAFRNGQLLQWDKRDGVWNLFEEKAAFVSYLSESINAMLTRVENK